MRDRNGNNIFEGERGGFIVKNQKARLCFYLILKACTSTRPLNDGCCSFKLGGCGENEGGCDDDSQCQGDLICGSGNCPTGSGSNFNSETNCCTTPLGVY